MTIAACKRPRSRIWTPVPSPSGRSTESLGAAELTALDRQFARILRHANEMFISGKQTRKYLLLGEECDLYVRKAVDLGCKRADAVGPDHRPAGRRRDGQPGHPRQRLDRGLRPGPPLHRAATVKDMDPVWVGTPRLSHVWPSEGGRSSGTSVDVLRIQDPSGATRSRSGCGTGCVAGAWRRRSRQHAKDVEEHVRETRKKSLTPEKQHQIGDGRARRASRTGRLTAISKAAEQIRDRAIEANVSSDDLLVTLVNRGDHHRPRAGVRPDGLA